jgi:hypothetical protein
MLVAEYFVTLLHIYFHMDTSDFHRNKYFFIKYQNTSSVHERVFTSVG